MTSEYNVPPRSRFRIFKISRPFPKQSCWRLTIEISLKRNDWFFHAGHHDLGRLCCGRRIQISWHSDFWISAISEHHPFWFECKQILRALLVLGILAILLWYPWLLLLSFVMLMILVQWILHKSLNHLSQFHLEVQVDLYTFGDPSNSAFFRWQMSISDAKCTVTPFFLASSITSDLLLTFARFHAGIFSSFSHSLSTAAFAAGIFITSGIGINLCTKIVMMQWITSFSCDVVFMNFRYNSFRTQSLWFICFQNARKFWFVIILSATSHPVPAVCLFTRHSWGCWNFQLLPCILDDLFEFHILRINEVNSSLPSYIFELRLFSCPIFAFLSIWTSLTYFSRFHATNRASPASGNESRRCNGGRDPSDSPRKSWWSSPRIGWSRIKVRVLSSSSPPESFTVPSATGQINFSPLSGVITSFALSLQAWISDATISSSPQGPQPECLIFHFSQRTIRRGIYQVILSYQIDGFATGLSSKEDDIQPMNQME